MTTERNLLTNVFSKLRVFLYTNHSREILSYVKFDSLQFSREIFLSSNYINSDWIPTLTFMISFHITVRFFFFLVLSIHSSLSFKVAQSSSWTSMFIVPLFTETRKWDQPRCPSANRWWKYIHNGVLLSYEGKTKLQNRSINRSKFSHRAGDPSDHRFMVPLTLLLSRTFLAELKPPFLEGSSLRHRLGSGSVSIGKFSTCCLEGSESTGFSVRR